MKPPSQRQLRVGELIRHILSDLLIRGEVRDPALDGVSVTVSEVRVSPDLRQATAYVAPLGAATGAAGAPQDVDAVIEGLNRSARFLRGEVGKRMTTKYTPQLRFEIDKSFEEASHVERLLRSDAVRRDLDGDPARDPSDERGDDRDED